jgi:tetratricopeptide (TPR) repeat protein
MITTLVLLVALGSPEPPTALVRVHFARGQRLFTQQRFADALGEFEAAAAAAPREVAELYFNIGQCQRNLGRARPAIAAFERYLDLRPDAPDRKQVRAIVARLHAGLPGPEQPEVAPATVAAPEVAPRAPEAAPATVPTASVRLELTTPAAPPPSPALAVGSSGARDAAPAPRPLYQRWWFWTGVGGAVVATSLGLYAGLHNGSSGAPQMMEPLGSAGTFDTRRH